RLNPEPARSHFMSALPLPAEPWTPLPPGAAEPVRSPQPPTGEVEPVDRADVGERKRALEDLLKARRLQADEPPLRGEDYRLRPLAPGGAPLHCGPARAV